MKRLLAAVAMSGTLVSATLPDASAATRVTMRTNDAGDGVLSLFDGETSAGIIATFICGPDRNEFVVALDRPGRPWPDGPLDVSVSADGASLGTLRFERLEEILLFDREGGEVRRMLGAIVASSTLRLDFGGGTAAFALGSNRDVVDKYKAACRI